jgi:hypothetical protein
MKSAPSSEPINTGGLFERRSLFQPTMIPSVVREAISVPGHALDSATRDFMEPRFGHDFSQVRVHTDTRAAESARAINARAYTVGSDVVFGENEFVPTTYRGRELLAHELAHTIQQRTVNGAGPSSDPGSHFENNAREAGRAVADGGRFSRSIPAAGIGLQCAPAQDLRWKNDEKAARYRGQLMATRIRTHGLLSKEARAKMNQELAYFEGAAKEIYLDAVGPILKATVGIEMPEMRVGKKVPPPPPVTWSLLKVDQRQMSEEEVDAPLIEAKHKEQEELEQARTSELEKLREKTKGWGADQEFALALLQPILEANVHPDPRSVAASIRQQILMRYEMWLRAENARRSLLCEKIPGGIAGFILKQQAAWQPSLDPCRDWFKDEYSHGPQELLQLERLLSIRGTGRDAVETVYWSVFEYRLLTDPLMLEQAAMAGEMVSGIAALGRVPGEPASPNLTFPRGTDVTNRSAFQAPDVVTPSRPVAGFARDMAPKPAPVVVTPTPYTQMPAARVVQGKQPTYGVVKPAYETSAETSTIKPSRPIGFRPPPKDIAEKPGLIEVETGPTEYVKKEYLGDVNPLGEQQSRYHVNIKLDEKGMMDADFVLRGGGKRSGSLFGKEEFLEAKQHFEQKNGAGSVKGAYGKWGGGDNLETFNNRYNIAKGKGFSHEDAMTEAARKTKTGEWSSAAGFKNVKVTKAEGSPGAFTNVEVEFTK